jgi:hypothetical protein
MQVKRGSRGIFLVRNAVVIRQYMVFTAEEEAGTPVDTVVFANQQSHDTIDAFAV